MRVQVTDPSSVITKFVPSNAAIITVDGHGLGFAHVGIEAKAREMGYGTTHDGFGYMPIYDPSDRHQWRELLGWLVEVSKSQIVEVA